MWCTRARGVSPNRCTAASDATSTALAASEICDDTAAVMRPPSRRVVEPGHLLQRRVGARALVDGHVAERDDLVVEAARRDRGQRALVALERELLHLARG